MRGSDNLALDPHDRCTRLTPDRFQYPWHGDLLLHTAHEPGIHQMQIRSRESADLNRLEMGFYTGRILVVVVDTSYLWMPTTTVKPHFAIAFKGVHAPLFKRIEKDNAVDGSADWTHWKTRDVFRLPRQQRQIKCEVVNSDCVWVSTVGEIGCRMIGVSLTANNKRMLIV